MTFRLSLAKKFAPEGWKVVPVEPPSAYTDLRPQTEADLLLDWLANLAPGEAQAIREDAGWTRAEVATHVGVTTNGFVVRWERNRKGWSRRTGLKYAGLLKELEPMRDDGLVTISEGKE